MRTIAVDTGLAWPEGPAVLSDGRLAFVETYRSQISTWSRHHGHAALANTTGGPNAVALGSDDHLYVCQNGGVVGPWRADALAAPSIQRVGLAGGVATVATEVAGIALQAPNDLAFGADGRLYFTDPGRYDPETRPDPGYIFALSPDGSGELVVDLGPVYPNGIVAESSGAIVWVESYTRAIRRRHPDGSLERLAVLDPGHIPDGLAIAANGDLYVTGVTSGGVDVVDAAGGVKDFIQVGSIPTNCAFGEGGVLYVTDGGRPGESEDASHGGVLWAVSTGVGGQPLFKGSIGRSA